MSTTPTDPTPAGQPTTGATAVEPTAEPADGTTPVSTSTSEGTLANVPATEETEESWVTRHTSTLIALMAAVVIAALAIAGVALYRNHQDEQNAETEAAFAEYITGQGAEVETVECDGDTCSAIIANSAYTVLVQEDEDGEKHFGVSAYTGD